MFWAISEIVGSSILILSQNSFSNFLNVKLKSATQAAFFKNYTF